MTERLELLGKKYNLDTGMEISEVDPGNPLPGTRVEFVVQCLLPPQREIINLNNYGKIYLDSLQHLYCRSSSVQL